VAVCGGGAAGLAAALAAARAGADVCLIEARPGLGGTVAFSLIHTLGGLYDSAGAPLNPGLAEELATILMRTDPSVRTRRMGRTWVLSACPDIYQGVVRDLVRAERRITVLNGMRVTGVVREANTIHELELSNPDGVSRLRVRSVIDATGGAEVTALVDTSLVQNEERRAAGGLIFRIQGVPAEAVAFPRGLGIVRAFRSAVEEGVLPRGCANTWVDVGARPDEVYVKLPVSLSGEWRKRQGEVTRNALQMQALVVEFLRQWPDFAQARVARIGELGVRDGGRVRGEYCLTTDDVRLGAKFPDAACRCSWPIEYWDPDTGVSLEYLPEGSFYEIPLRALKVSGVRNLWAAGKCLSADRFAQASARVVGSCWAMGEAVGRQAAAV
jgi:hypothetical protein